MDEYANYRLLFVLDVEIRESNGSQGIEVQWTKDGKEQLSKLPNLWPIGLW